MYEEEYERLNVRFDVYTGGGKVGKEAMDNALTRLEEMGLISDSNGAKLVELEKWKLGKAVVRMSSYFSPLTHIHGQRVFPRRNFHLPYP